MTRKYLIPILEYFDRLNRRGAAGEEGGGS